MWLIYYESLYKHGEIITSIIFMLYIFNKNVILNYFILTNKTSS